MNTKYIQIAIAALITLFGKNGHLENNFIESIKTSVRAEISAILFKLMSGMILTALVILSLFQLGSAFQTWINQLEYGLTFQFIAFGLLGLISLGSLYYLFHHNNENSQKEIQRPQYEEARSNSSFVEDLAFKFAEGFAKGLNSEPDSQQTRHDFSDSNDKN